MPTPSASTIIQHARSHNRLLLTEVEAKTLLAAAGLPVAQTQLAGTREEAITLAQSLGCPVALKICSPDVVHKSDVGGVKLGLTTPAAVGEAFDDIMQAVKRSQPSAAVDGVSVQPMAKSGAEVIIGLTTDPQFGPVCMFGLGGISVEVLKDVAFRLAPLRPRDAHAMIREIRGFPLLTGYRGQPAVDLAALEHLLFRCRPCPKCTLRLKNSTSTPCLRMPRAVWPLTRVLRYTAQNCLRLHGHSLP